MRMWRFRGALAIASEVEGRFGELRLHDVEADRRDAVTEFLSAAAWAAGDALANGQPRAVFSLSSQPFAFTKHANVAAFPLLEDSKQRRQ